MCVKIFSSPNVKTRLFLRVNKLIKLEGNFFKLSVVFSLCINMWKYPPLKIPTYIIYGNPYYPDYPSVSTKNNNLSWVLYWKLIKFLTKFIY